MSVHVIDDDEDVRESLAMALGARGLSVRTYASAEDFRVRLVTAPAGCVIADVMMPGMTGLELLGLLAPRREEFPTIIVTGRGNVPMAVEALKGGAIDFFEKPVDPGVLFEAVQTALHRMRDQQAHRLERVDYRRRRAQLSPREREVLDRLVGGWSNKMIAREFSLSPRTVEAYRANLMAKMQAKTLSDLVRMGLLADELD